MPGPRSKGNNNRYPKMIKKKMATERLFAAPFYFPPFSNAT
jgi:hypothetical protein